MDVIASPSVSVVICAYTELRWDELLKAVRSVQLQTHPPQELIVVIDHNPALLARAGDAMPGVKVMPNTETKGLSGARNTGVDTATGAIVAFLDDDAEASPDWIAELLAGYDRAEVMGVGGHIEPNWQHGRPPWFPDEFNWVVGCSYRGMPRQPAPVRNLIGANMSMRRAAIVEAGGFRTGMGRIGTVPLGCEETELCIRISQRRPGSSFRYIPSARVRHLVTPARGRWGYFRSRCYAEGLSKAQVTTAVGSDEGLASERSYTMRTLPAGVIRGLADTLRGDLGGLRRSAAITAGLAITTGGYLRGLVSRP